MKDINEKKEALMEQKISVYDLELEEVKKIKATIQKDLKAKRQELDEINQKIKGMKTKIDNWSNE